MPEITDLNKLILNVLTQDQYNGLAEKNEDELYLIKNLGDLDEGAGVYFAEYNITTYEEVQEELGKGKMCYAICSIGENSSKQIYCALISDSDAKYTFFGHYDNVFYIFYLSQSSEWSQANPIEYLNCTNPTGTGSLSINRKADSEIGDYSAAIGYDNVASGEGAIALGYKTKALDFGSFAEGYTTIANYYDHAEGDRTKALGGSSHTEGYKTETGSNNAHAEGHTTFASGYNAHAEGIRTISCGVATHSEGLGDTGSIYLTGNANTKTYSFNVDENNILDCLVPGATIIKLILEDDYIIQNQVSCSPYAEIQSIDLENKILTLSETLSPDVNLDNHIAFIYNNIARGLYSHTEGTGTIARGESSHVQGKYNISDPGTMAHIVGNGANTGERSNAHTLDWSGNAWFAGDVYVRSASGTNKDEGSKKLATEEYVNNNSTSYEYGTIDLEDGVSELATGKLYFYYEE